MSAGALVVVIVAVVCTVGFVVWMVANRRHPEAASGHTTASQASSGGTSMGIGRRRRTLDFHGDVSDRPAGPGAEADGVAGAGQPVPGPSADSLEQPMVDRRRLDPRPPRADSAPEGAPHDR